MKVTMLLDEMPVKIEDVVQVDFSNLGGADDTEWNFITVLQKNALSGYGKSKFMLSEISQIMIVEELGGANERN